MNFADYNELHNNYLDIKRSILEIIKKLPKCSICGKVGKYLFENNCYCKHCKIPKNEGILISEFPWADNASKLLDEID